MQIKIILSVLGIFFLSANQEKPIPVLDYNGLEPFLNKQNDTTYVVNFWATWCAPCVKELPYFEQITENYKNKKVKILLISLDFPKSYQSTLVPFVKKRGLKSDVILLNDPNSNNWINKINENWSGAIPATLFYNKQKRSFYEKPFTYQKLDSVLNIHLNINN